MFNINEKIYWQVNRRVNVDIYYVFLENYDSVG